MPHAMRMGTEAVEWASGLPELARIESDWERLADDDPFVGPTWFRCWWKAFGANRQMRVAVARRDGAVVGVLPMMSGPFRALSSASSYHSPRYGAAAVDRDAVETLIHAAMASNAGEVHFHALDKGSAEADIAEEAAGWHRRYLHVDECHSSPWVDTTGDLEEYLRRVPAEQRRRRRKLEREHDAAFRLDDGGEDLASDLDAGFALEAAGWKGARGTAIATHGDTERFYRSLAHAERGCGSLRIAWLHVDGRAAAWNLMIERGGRLHLLKTAHDEQLRRLAPGIMLNLMVVEHCFAARLSSFEMLGAADPWKDNFATGSRPHVRLWAWSRRPLPLARRAVRRNLAPAARRVLSRAG